MRIRVEGSALRRQLRQRMLERVFSGVPDDGFERCLELGAGEGFQSSIIARHARSMVATEIRVGKLMDPAAANTRYLYCDAERLTFRPNSFDLIVSSHLLEHLPDLARALNEMRLALRDDGVMVHFMPTRFWKLLDFGLFYPSQIAHLIEKYTEPRVPAPLAATGRSTVKAPDVGWKRRSFWPPVHGTARNNFTEFVRFRRRFWVRQFARAGFEVAGIVGNLPVHSPYRFGSERARRLLESLGATSSLAYVAVKSGTSAERASWFLRASAPTGSRIRGR